MQIGDSIIYQGYAGTILDIWEGKYTCPYYDGEQYNPYRITVRMGREYCDKYGYGLCEDGTITAKMEALT